MTSPENLRIVYTSTYCWPEVRRGGERVLHELAAAMRRAGHDVSIVSTGSARGGHVLGVPVRRLRPRRVLRRRFGDLAEEAAFGAQSLLHLLPRRWDVWHAFTTPDGAAAATAARFGSRASVYTDLGIPVARFREQRPDRRLHQLIVDHVDVYTTLTRTAGEYLERDYGRSALTAGGGVNVDRFRPSDRRHERPAVLFASHLTEPRKNAPLLLDAIALMVDAGTDLELWLLGPGDPDELLRNAPAAARSAVTVVDADPDRLIERYPRAWTTVLPSTSEALGLVVLESLASGTPAVVLEDSGGPAELVDRNTGVTCEATPESLARAIAAALELARQTGTVEACRAAAMQWDWDRSVVPRFEAMYGGTLQGSG